MLMLSCWVFAPSSASSKDRFGSIATLRFLNLQPFDQLFMWLGSRISERLHCGFLHGGRDDELRLLSA